MEVITRRRKQDPETPRKMSVSERQALSEEKAALEAQQSDMSYAAHPDKGSLTERIRQLSDMLNKDEDAEAKGKTRAKLEGIRDQLAQQVKLKVPPMSLQRARPGTPEYPKAVAWAERALDPEVVKICEQYQDVCRRLDPDNPNAGSVEALVS